MRAMARCDMRSRLVLLVDEFTDIFKEIIKGKMPRQFMTVWKAIVEKRYFSSVLVGQDNMPKFKAEFPNEFGVADFIRVSYLTESDAMRMIREPIGEDRFKGRAMGRILDLTAGSPFYTMIFCDQLVNYINDTRSVVVTEADVLEVEKTRVLYGDQRLEKEDFDNLLRAASETSNRDIDPDATLGVCVAIAQGSKDGWCPREEIRSVDGRELDWLLSDLERRDVIQRKDRVYRLRVGLFRDWLLL